jgi:hypothetical protein
MKSRWKIFLVINIVVIVAFAISLIIPLLQTFVFSAGFKTSPLGLLLIAGFSAVVLINCIRNISLCKVVLYNKVDMKVKPGHTSNLTALFSVTIFFLGYGLIRGYDGLRLSFFTRNIFQIIAYIFQVITVVCGAYIIFHQGALSKLAASILEKEINNSIDEIGS